MVSDVVVSFSMTFSLTPAFPPVGCSRCSRGLPLTVADKQVLEADVESRVRGGSENLTRLADDVLRTTVVIAHRVLDLYGEKN